MANLSYPFGETVSTKFKDNGDGTVAYLRTYKTSMMNT